MSLHDLARRSESTAFDAPAAAIEVDPTTLRRMIGKAASRFDDVSMVASREADRRSELEALVDPLIGVPWTTGDIHDLAGLSTIAAPLRGT